MDDDEVKDWMAKWDSDPVTRLAVTWVALAQNYQLDEEGGGELIQMFNMTARMGGYTADELRALLLVSLRFQAMCVKLLHDNGVTVSDELLKDMMKQGWNAESN